MMYTLIIDTGFASNKPKCYIAAAYQGPCWKHRLEQDTNYRPGSLVE